MTSHAQFDHRGVWFDLSAEHGWQLYAVMTHITQARRYYNEFLSVNHGKPFENIWDIGANIGGTALAYSSMFPEAAITAIEPIAENYKLLEHNCKGHNILTMQCAAHSDNGRLWLAMPTIEQRPDKTSALDFTENTGLFSAYGSGERGEWAEAFTLDWLVGKSPVDFIKIDVEGNEIAVLEGARSILQNQRPTFLLEIRNANQEMAGKSVDELSRFMARHQYTAFAWVQADVLFIPG